MQVFFKMRKMKPLTLSILLFFPFMLLAQSSDKLLMSKKVIKVKALVEQTFGLELEKRHAAEKEMFGTVTELENFGIFEFRNLLDINQQTEPTKVLSKAYCELLNGELSISNAIGFKMAVGHTIILKPKGKTYRAQFFHYTDQVKMHKLRPEDDFIEDIQVDFSQVTLELSPDSSLKPGGIIKGQLHGTTIPYYEIEGLGPKSKPIQYQIRSVFECRLESDMELQEEAGMEDLEEENQVPKKKKKGK